MTILCVVTIAFAMPRASSTGTAAIPGLPYGDEPVAAAVTRFDVPFMRLVMFFLKAVFAAIPALILLGVLLWFAGHILQTQFPELIKMKILITFPNG